MKIYKNIYLSASWYNQTIFLSTYLRSDLYQNLCTRTVHPSLPTLTNLPADLHKTMDQLTYTHLQAS